MAQLNDNSKTVYEYVKSMQGQNITAADIADATGLGIKTVNGIVTSAFQKKGIMQRTPAVITVDGEPKQVKFISLTEEALESFDPEDVDGWVEAHKAE